MKGLMILALVMLTFSFGVWIYWAVLYQMLRKKIAFRAEQDLIKLNLLALEGKIRLDSEIGRTIKKTLETSYEAAETQGWVYFMPVPKDEQKRHEAELRKLSVELDNEDVALRKAFDRAFNNLVVLYLLHRPVLVLAAVLPLALSLYWAGLRYRREKTELEYAAATMSVA